MAHYRNSSETYDIIAQAFYWLVAALVLAQLGFGVYAATLPIGLARLQWLSRHKSLGLGVLALVRRDGVMHRMLPWKPRKKK